MLINGKYERRSQLTEFLEAAVLQLINANDYDERIAASNCKQLWDNNT